MKLTACVVPLLLALCGCTKPFESKALGIHYEPPSGIELLSESAGPPRVARFSSGLAIYAVDGTLAPLDANDVPPILTQALALSHLPPLGALSTARAGTIPAGRVARFEDKSGDSESLVYVIPGEGHFHIITLTAPESRFAHLEAKVEQSFATLRLTQ